jgi:hypothetical protein
MTTKKRHLKYLTFCGISKCNFYLILEWNRKWACGLSPLTEKKIITCNRSCNWGQSLISLSLSPSPSHARKHAHRHKPQNVCKKSGTFHNNCQQKWCQVKENYAIIIHWILCTVFLYIVAVLLPFLILKIIILEIVQYQQDCSEFGK